MTSLRGQVAAIIADEVYRSGRTQVDIAHAVGITPKHLNQILRGHIAAGVDMTDRILTALGRHPILATVPLAEEPT